MSKMLLSIKPDYIRKIMKGDKKYEFRKIRCRSDVTGIIFYETAPTKKIVAEAEIDEIIEGSAADVWRKTERHAGISHDFYNQYYKKSKRAVAYKLKNVLNYTPPKTLKDFGLTTPPQSMVYIN